MDWKGKEKRLTGVEESWLLRGWAQDADGRKAILKSQRSRIGYHKYENFVEKCTHTAYFHCEIRCDSDVS
jgi:hypothetical protein